MNKKILFDMGDAAYFKTASDLYTSGEINEEEVITWMSQHVRGNYGLVSEDIQKDNEEIIESGDRGGKHIISVYKQMDNEYFVIYTRFIDVENETRLLTLDDMQRYLGFTDNGLVMNADGKFGMASTDRRYNNSVKSRNPVNSYLDDTLRPALESVAIEYKEQFEMYIKYLNLKEEDKNVNVINEATETLMNGFDCDLEELSELMSLLISDFNLFMDKVSKQNIDIHILQNILHMPLFIKQFYRA